MLFIKTGKNNVLHNITSSTEEEAVGGSQVKRSPYPPSFPRWDAKALLFSSIDVFGGRLELVTNNRTSVNT